MRNNTTAKRLVAAAALAIGLVACAQPATTSPVPDQGTKEVWHMCTVDETKASGTVPCQHPGGRGL